MSHWLNWINLSYHSFLFTHHSTKYVPLSHSSITLDPCNLLLLYSQSSSSRLSIAPPFQEPFGQMEFIPPWKSHKSFICTSVYVFTQWTLTEGPLSITILTTCFVIYQTESALETGCKSDLFVSHKQFLVWTLFAAHPVSASSCFLFSNRILCCLGSLLTCPDLKKHLTSSHAAFLHSFFFLPSSLPSVLPLSFLSSLQLYNSP